MSIRMSVFTALLIASGSAVATEATQTTEPAAVQESEQIQQAAGSVARAGFASDIQEREPVDNLKQLENNNEKIYYFTELKDMAGQTITHRWEHNGQVMAEIPFEVRGDRWRIYSSKNLDPSWTGEWKASVVTSGGETLSVNTFNYTAAATDAGTANQAAPAEGNSATQ